MRIPRLVLGIALIACFTAGAALAMNKTDKVVLKLAAPGNWTAGSTVRCTWDWGNLDGNVEITLWKANRLVATLAPSCALGSNGTGSVSVTVPARLAAGAYEVRVKSLAHPEIVARQPVAIAAAAGRALPFDDGSRGGSGPQG